MKTVCWLFCALSAAQLVALFGTCRARSLKDGIGQAIDEDDELDGGVEDEETLKGKRKKKKRSEQNVRKLTQSDFLDGTYRITESGVYVLEEDIEFAPQIDNDYWPPMELWGTYPPADYYLGFFAAVAVEADGVEIDLNGFEIRQSEEFYLVQRFYNNIQLNNRVFVANEGVSSLNYQRTDRVAGTVAGPLVTPTNVLIKNGSLGRSSHAGIHGNSIQGLTVENVRVHDFEVAGIQCNGCKNVKIHRTEVGPASQNVPVIATFANSRFFEFYTNRLIPLGFAQEPMSDSLLSLFDDTITFADRPNRTVTLRSVFQRNSDAVTLFRRYNRGEDLSGLSPQQRSLLEEAKRVFVNPLELPDGSALYGILLNRRGLPPTDDQFVGAGRETADIEISKVKIHGLRANPIEVPSLTTDEGTHMQGPIRDLLRIADITTDRLRTILDSQYKGNFLSDVYFAIWQLSNNFYRLRVFDSDCGNFGSNASMPFNLVSFPSENIPTCADLGTTSDPALTGRQVTLLQKRYFGGLQLTQGVYDWATTPGKGLEGLLSRPARHDLQRAGYRHMIVCDHDTMFHPMHGVVALKLVEAANVVVSDVEVTDLKNSADLQIWTCGNVYPWQMQPSGEDIRAVTEDSDSEQAPMIRGVELVRCNDVAFKNVAVTNLASEEGASIGFDVVGDRNDRSDHMDDEGISFKKVLVERLSGPRGGMAFKSGGATPIFVPKGITFGLPEEVDASLGAPRMIMNYQMTNSRSPRLSPDEKLPSLTFTNEQVLIDFKRTTTFDTDDKIRAYRKRVLSFYREHYGMRFADDVDEAPFLDPLVVYTRDGEPTTSVVQFGQLALETEYHATSICISNGDSSEGNCSDASISLVHDFAFNFFPGPEGYTFHGAFGGDAGRFCPENNIVWVGLYSFERVNFPGVNENANLQVEYYGECPTPLIKFYGDQVSFYINCAVESDIFGKGMATGAFIFEPSDNGEEWILNGYPSMIFDDQVVAPVKSPVATTFFDEDFPNIETNDWRFSFIADGLLPNFLGGIEAVAFGLAHHFTHEAGVQYLKRRTSINTDEGILALRRNFLSRLSEMFGINLDPGAFDDVPLDGVVDLGGGNKIMAYVVNEDANQRVVTKRGFDGAKTIVMPKGSRLHEGGFRLVVGRAGVVTEKGRIPFGSVFQEGVYVLEDSTAEDLEIEFYSMGPAIMNAWTTTVVYQGLHHPVLGEGRLYALYPLPETRKNGRVIAVRGAMVFGNLSSPDGFPQN